MDLPNAPFLKKIELKPNGSWGRYADEIMMKNEKKKYSMKEIAYSYDRL